MIALLPNYRLGGLQGSLIVSLSILLPCIQDILFLISIFSLFGHFAGEEGEKNTPSLC